MTFLLAAGFLTSALTLQAGFLLVAGFLFIAGFFLTEFLPSSGSNWPFSNSNDIRLGNHSGIGWRSTDLGLLGRVLGFQIDTSKPVWCLEVEKEYVPSLKLT